MPLLVALSKPRPIVRIDLPRSTSPRRVSPLHADRNWQAERRPKPPLEKPSMWRSPPTTWYRVRFYRTAKTIADILLCRQTVVQTVADFPLPIVSFWLPERQFRKFTKRNKVGLGKRKNHDFPLQPLRKIEADVCIEKYRRVDACTCKRGANEREQE